MFYGASSKQRSQISSYIIKHPNKHKHNTSKKMGISLNHHDKDASKSSLNTFRKNASKDNTNNNNNNSKHTHSKYKTSKNSPNRSFKSPPELNNKDFTEIIKEIPEKILYSSNNNIHYHKNITPNQRIKENNNVDNLFMKKIQKIHTKATSFNGMNQLTHSNLFFYNNTNSNTNNNNHNHSKSKVHLETSLHKHNMKPYNNIKHSNINLT